MTLLGILLLGVFFLRTRQERKSDDETQATRFTDASDLITSPTSTLPQVAIETPVATVARIPTPLPNPPYIKPVCDWTPLLAVNQGDVVYVQVVRGSWAVWSGPGGMRHRTDGTGYVDERPSGDPLSSAPAGALIGRIGNGELIYIGKTKNSPASQSGTLELRINDTMCNDNTGGLSVRLSVTAPGGQTPHIVEPVFIPPDPTEPTTLAYLGIPVNQVAFSPDRETLAVASSPGIHVYDTATLAELYVIETEKAVIMQ